jgi:hypothetical protein
MDYEGGKEMNLSLAASGWDVLYSKNCPAHPNDSSNGWVFYVKDTRQPHYILKGANDAVRSAIKDANSVINIAMTITDENLKSVQDGGTNTYATVMLQREGDTLTGQGKYEWYRLWCGGAKRISLVNGYFQVSIPMDRNIWTGVFGRVASDIAWSGTLNNLGKIGITLGGTSDFGHGIKGVGKLYLNKFEII